MDEKPPKYGDFNLILKFGDSCTHLRSPIRAKFDIIEGTHGVLYHTKFHFNRRRGENGAIFIKFCTSRASKPTPSSNQSQILAHQSRPMIYAY